MISNTKFKANKGTLRIIVAVLLMLLFISSCFLTASGPDPPTDLGNIDPPEAKEKEDYYSLEKFIERSEKVRDRFVLKRDVIFQDKNSDLSQLNPWESKDGMYFWDYFPPTFTCPYSEEKIGAAGDGGHWTCGFDLISDNLKDKVPPCVVYTFGSSTISASFETEFLSRTNCYVYMYDYRANAIVIGLKEGYYDERKVNFELIRLGNVTSDLALTFGDILTGNGHAFVDFVKMDVDGDEYDVLEQILDEFETLPFRHLNLEVHLNSTKDKNGSEDESKYGQQFQRFYNLWTKLEAKGLRAFNREAIHRYFVRDQGKPLTYEYSFVNLNLLMKNQN